jgi:hypothetical protein
MGSSRTGLATGGMTATRKKMKEAVEKALEAKFKEFFLAQMA